MSEPDRQPSDVPTETGLHHSAPNTHRPSDSVLDVTPMAPLGAYELPGYEIVGELGRGGMGVVYKGWDIAHKRHVAVKMILTSHSPSHRRRRFLNEMEALKQLQHPNIVQLHATGEFSGLPYFAFEFCAGGSLSKKIGGNPMPPQKAAMIAEKLAHGIAAAHQLQIIHRDLKPGNILLTAEEEPKITDFGVAKNLARDEGITRTGALLGTVNYMPPEQAFLDSKDLTPMVDIYAIGAILYEMLTGRPPFKGTTMMETVEQLRLQTVVPPRMLVGRIPEPLERICLKCLSKDPRDRYPSAEALAEDLQLFRAGKPISILPTTSSRRLRSWMAQHPWRTIGWGMLALSYVGTIAGTVAYFTR